MKPRVAVLDDEQRMVEILSMILERDGYDVRTFVEPQAAIDAYGADPFDLLITDLRMPDFDGVEVLKRLRAQDANLPVILITAHATVSIAIAAMREGAFDYVQKPIDNDELCAVVKRALDLTKLARENRYLRAEVRGRYALDRVVAESRAMREALDLARRAARFFSTKSATSMPSFRPSCYACCKRRRSDALAERPRSPSTYVWSPQPTRICAPT